MTLYAHRRGMWMAALAGTLTLSAFTVASDAQALGPQVLAQNKIPAWKVKKDAKSAYVKGKALMSKGDYAAAAEQFEKAFGIAGWVVLAVVVVAVLLMINR